MNLLVQNMQRGASSWILQLAVHIVAPTRCNFSRNFWSLAAPVLKIWPPSCPPICCLHVCLVHVHCALIFSHIWQYCTILLSTLLCYISLLSGLWNLDDRHQYPMSNNKDHLVGQLTTAYFDSPAVIDRHSGNSRGAWETWGRGACTVQSALRCFVRGGGSSMAEWWRESIPGAAI